MRYWKTLPVFFLVTGFLLGCTKKNEQSAEKSFTQTIERISANSFEASLIEKAEKYYPPRDEVIYAAQQWNTQIPDSGYWYYGEFDGVRIPFCITGDAVDYYSNLIDEFNKKPYDTFSLSAEFTYKVEVEFKENYSSPPTNSTGEVVIPDEFTSVYVVSMELKWNDYCGPLCAMWINKQRFVVFDKDGNLLRVYHDGETPVPVS